MRKKNMYTCVCKLRLCERERSVNEEEKYVRLRKSIDIDV